MKKDTQDTKRAGTSRAAPAVGGDRESDRIQPWTVDRRFWQYLGQPILLIGASDEDNLFNHPELPPAGLEAHLDRMVSAGGNYIRNTLSSRDPGNRWPFFQNPDTGLYDLSRFDEDYWERLRRLLEMTARRGVIVQIELWDRFDFAREPWRDNPFNPINHAPGLLGDAALPECIETHPGKRENPFFRSTPDHDTHNPALLDRQRALVRQVLEVSLGFDHVLYCLSNETNDSEAWSTYWAKFVWQVARERRLGIELTEMWDKHDLRDPMHERTFDHPELYSFVDISQNSHQIGQNQWDNLQWVRGRVADPPRPINSVKMYGGQHGGGPEEGQHKLWRNVLGGVASARYHRPGAGIGLNSVTEAHLRSLGLLLDAVDIFALTPANELLGERSEDEAYLAAAPGRWYALYFPRSGSVTLDLRRVSGPWRLRWLEVLAGRWAPEHDATLEGGHAALVQTPGEGPWAAAVVARD